MPETTPLGARVAASTADRFHRYVDSDKAEFPGEPGLELRMALRDCRDVTRCAEVEDRLRSLLDEGGTEKNSTSGGVPPSDRSDTSQLGYRLPVREKEAFQAWAKDKNTTFGVAVEYALEERMGDARRNRLQRRLDRLEDRLAGTTGTDTDTGDDLDAVERRTRAIAARLPEEFTDEDLEEAIQEQPKTGTSRPTIKKYRERVLDHLDLEDPPGGTTDVTYSEDTTVDKIIKTLRESHAEKVSLQDIYRAAEEYGITAKDTRKEYVKRVTKQGPFEQHPYIKQHWVFTIESGGESNTEDRDTPEEPDTPDTPDGPPTADSSATVAPDGGRDEAIQSYADEPEDDEDAKDEMDRILSAEPVR